MRSQGTSGRRPGRGDEGREGKRGGRGSSSVPARSRRTTLAGLGGEIQTRGPLGDWVGEILEGLENERADTLTHGFHAYPARMHPVVPRRILSRLGARGMVVLDPFVGGGTVVVEAMVAGCRAVGSDINPVAIRVAGARSTVRSRVWVDRFVTRAREISEAAYLEARRKRSRPWTPVARRHRTWFAPHVLQELMALEVRIRSIPLAEERALAFMVLSSLLVKVSQKRAETVEERAMKRVGRGTTARLFGRKAVELGERLRALAAVVPEEVTSPILCLADARSLPLPEGVVDLVITSPPYAGTYDYARVQALRLAWLGEPVGLARRYEIGTRGGGRRGQGFTRDQARVVHELRRILRPGGRAFVLVGDGVLGGKPYRADAALERAARAAGLGVEGVASQPRPHVNRAVAEAYGGETRYEHLIVLVQEARSGGVSR